MNIRRKLGFSAEEPIKAVYGVGYKFEMGNNDR
jgi:DNA-binding response OmpR family regulator